MNTNNSTLSLSNETVYTLTQFIYSVSNTRLLNKTAVSGSNEASPVQSISNNNHSGYNDDLAAPIKLIRDLLNTLPKNELETLIVQTALAFELTTPFTTSRLEYRDTSNMTENEIKLLRAPHLTCTRIPFKALAAFQQIYTIISTASSTTATTPTTPRTTPHFDGNYSLASPFWTQFNISRYGLIAPEFSKWNSAESWLLNLLSYSQQNPDCSLAFVSEQYTQFQLSQPLVGTSSSNREQLWLALFELFYPAPIQALKIKLLTTATAAAATAAATTTTSNSVSPSSLSWSSLDAKIIHPIVKTMLFSDSVSLLAKTFQQILTHSFQLLVTSRELIQLQGFDFSTTWKLLRSTCKDPFSLLPIHILTRDIIQFDILNSQERLIYIEQLFQLLEVSPSV